MSELSPSSYDRPHSMDSNGYNADTPFNNHEIYDPVPGLSPDESDIVDYDNLPDYGEQEPDYGDIYPNEYDTEKPEATSQEVRRSIHQIEATESVIADHTGEKGQELADSTADFLAEHVKSVEAGSLDEERVITTALVEGALEATGHRPGATVNPIVKLREDGYGQQVIDGVKRLYDEDAVLPNGQPVAEVITKVIDDHDERLISDQYNPPEISLELDTAVQYFVAGIPKSELSVRTGFDPDELTAYIRGLPDEQREFILEMRRRSLDGKQEALQASEQKEKNLELLRNSEMGEVLEKVYLDAVELDGRLANIAILPMEIGDHRDAYARAEWTDKNQTGKHEVFINLNDIPASLSKFKDRIDSIPINTAKSARTLDVLPSEVTPELLFVQSMIHEMGHVVEFMDYQEAGKTPEQHRKDRKIEHERLPLERSVTALEKHKDRVLENWTSLSKIASAKYSAHKATDLRISNFEELVGATADVYRDTKFEHAADAFAARVLSRRPGLIESLKK